MRTGTEDKCVYRTIRNPSAAQCDGKQRFPYLFQIVHIGLNTRNKLNNTILKDLLITDFYTTILMIVILALFFVTLSAGFDLLYRLVRGWIG